MLLKRFYDEGLAQASYLVGSESGEALVIDPTRDLGPYLEAAADEIRHMLDEGVVGDAADVDACLILGAGYPFFLGGITKHLEQVGIADFEARVTA